MAYFQGEAVTRWVSSPGRHDMEIALKYSGAFSDATGQPDENIAPDPNALVVWFEVDEATLAQMLADPDLVVLWYEQKEQLP
jgi:hypothetical protein